jgi:Glycosyl hydrolases family 16
MIPAMSEWELELDETFDGPVLDDGVWLPYYLPQWSSRERAAARYRFAPGGGLELLIEADQEQWCPEWDGELVVSSLQTGVFAGPVGSHLGQLSAIDDAAVVREAQPETRLYTPHFGRIETRLRAIDHPRAMVALWMPGFEDTPERSGEICLVEIFGRDILGPDRARVGMGVHKFGDPALTEEWAQEELAIDVTQPHEYAAEWSPGQVAFFVDGEHVKTVGQAPDYPLQLMLSVYEFPGEEAVDYPHVFAVEYVRGYRRSSTART